MLENILYEYVVAWYVVNVMCLRSWRVLRNRARYTFAATMGPFSPVNKFDMKSDLIIAFV